MNIKEGFTLLENELSGLRETLENRLRLDEIERGYSGLARQHSGFGRWLMKLRSMFGCGEQLGEVGGLYRMIGQTGKNEVEINFQDDGKLLESWIGAYRSTLKRTGGANEVTPEYVEELCGTELADRAFLSRVEKEPSLAGRLGGFTELDSAVRNQLERELSRVEKELERREGMYEDELCAPDYQEEREKAENIELLLSATYELSRMRKRCGMATERTEGVREELERRLKVIEAEQNREQKKPRFEWEDKARLPVPEEERAELAREGKPRGEERPKREEKPKYLAMISEAKDHLMEIGERYSSQEIMGIGGIRELFAAKESYYRSIQACGGAACYEVVENLLRDIYTSERKKIERFVRQNEHGPMDEVTIRKAAHYRRLMDAWEKRLDS